MTEEKARGIIYDTVRQFAKWGKRPTQILVHPDYKHLVELPAAEAGLDVVLNLELFAPLDKFFFK